MEEEILKTLILFDLLDFPLKSYEIHKFLVEEKISLNDIDKGLKSLEKRKEIIRRGGLYALFKRRILISRRFKRLKFSKAKLARANALSKLFFIIPWIKLAGISDDLSRLNLKSNKEKVGLILICNEKRQNLSFYLVNLILNAFGISDKYIIDWIVTTEYLEVNEKNIYSALKILSIILFWQKNSFFNLLLEKNPFCFDYFPNWISPIKTLVYKRPKKSFFSFPRLIVFDYLDEKIGNKLKISNYLEKEEKLAMDYSKMLRKYRLKLPFDQKKID